METQCKHLKKTQRNELLKLLQTFKELFDVTLVPWKTDPVEPKLKENSKPICLRSYPLPKVQEEMFKNEVES